MIVLDVFTILLDTEELFFEEDSRWDSRIVEYTVS